MTSCPKKGTLESLMPFVTASPATADRDAETAPDFRTLFESAPGLYLVLKPDFTIVAVSDAYLHATMTRRADILGRGIFDVFPDNPEDTQASGVRNLRASLLRVRDGGRADTMAVQKYDIRRPEAEGGGFEERYWSPVNSPVFDRDSKLAYIIHRVEDVTHFIQLKQQGAEQGRATEELRTRTEQMEAEIFQRAQQLQEVNRQLRGANEELLEAQERFRALMDSAPDAMVVVDEHGRIVLVNARTEALFGYPRQELLGQSVERLIPARFRTEHPQHRSSYMSSPVVRPMGANIELHALHRDGSEIPVEISLSPVATRSGLQVVSAIRDISDRRRTLEQLREARNEADKANRAKSSFLATASHDLRQPLQTLALLNGALRRLVREGRAAAALGEQEIAIGVMSRLLNALLDISKLESGTLRPDLTLWSVGSLFEQMRSEFASVAASKGLQLEVQSVDACVRSDQSLIGQVLRNLLTNAIKYTNVGQVVLRSRVGDGVAHVEVIDTGIGMAPEELTRICEDFYQIGVTANTSREGYGLGLSIVSRIIKLLGLQLEVRSEPGNGSTFSFALPLAGAPLASGAQPGAAASHPSRNSREHHILVVEDDVAVLNATRVLLTVQGYRVSTAGTLAEALEHIRANPDIELLITDYHLAGGETGRQVISAIREIRGQKFKAVMISGDTSSAARGLRGDAALRFLSKPVSSADLMNLLEGLLAAPDTG